jgi:DNA-directed RNA polymerase subunit RPC12/RpoP
MLQKHRHRRLDGDVGPTPETVVQHRRRRGDTIEALVCSRKLDYAQQAAALQIAEVFEALTAALWTRGTRWEQGRIDGGNSGAVPERMACLYRRRFLPWARWMSSPASLFQACLRCGARQLVPYRLDACQQCGSRRLWRAQPHLPLVLSIAVYGAGLEHCAREYRMRRTRALQLLKLGLERYHDFS